MFEKLLTISIKTEEEEDKENKEHLKMPFFHAIKCAAQVYCDKIISSNLDMMGVVFYGSKEKNNQFDFENVYIFQDMKVPDAYRIKQLESMLNDRSVKQFQEQFGHATEKGSLHDALWTCQHLFSQLPKNVAYKRIFLFTNDDDPFPKNGTDNTSLRNKCIERVKDLVNSDIMLELFVIKDKNAKFDKSVFWQHVLYRPDDEYAGQIFIDAIDSFQQLLDGVRRKTYTKRALSTFELEIGPLTKRTNTGNGNSSNNALSLSVSMYNLISRASKGNPVHLHSATNRLLKSETKFICEDTGNELMKSDIKYAYDYGGVKVTFEAEELLKIRNFGTKGMKLMGFKPKDCLKAYQNYTSSGFIYPNDSLISGSFIAFSALHKKMLEMNKIAICRYIARDGSIPVYVALLPQEERLDSEDRDIQLSPPGFNVIYLPYADSIRKLEDVLVKKNEEKVEPTEKQLENAKKVIKCLNVDITNAEFDNPLLQNHYAILKALAVNPEKLEKIVDHIQPDLEGMQKYSNIIEEFKDSVLPKDYDPNKSTTKRATSRAASTTNTAASTKRKNRAIKEETVDEAVIGESCSKNNSNQKPAKKKARKNEEDEEEEIDMVDLAKNSKLHTLTVPVLKQFCSLYSIKASSSKKKDIIDAIINFLRTKGKL
jgi:ATP-dependent DNA helicase 2 subunit 1